MNGDQNTALTVAMALCGLVAVLLIEALARHDGNLLVGGAFIAAVSLALGSYGWLRQHRERGRL